MTWQLEQIPRVAHFYWDQQVLPYLRYLTLHTFSKFNPQWELILWEPVELRDELLISWQSDEHKGVKSQPMNYRNRLEAIPNLSIRKNATGDTPSMSGVLESDLLRWRLLSTIGGLWSDMDILFIKPIEALSVNIQANRDCRQVVCFDFYEHMTNFIGVLLGSPSNELYGRIFKEASRSIDVRRYQSIGSSLMDQFVHTNSITLDRIVNLGLEEFYLYRPENIDYLFTHNESRPLSRIVGIHWYAGHSLSTRLCSQMNHENYEGFRNTMASLIRAFA